MFYYIEETPQSLFFDLIPKNASTDILNALINYGNTENNIKNDFYICEHLPENMVNINQDNNFIDTIPDIKNLFKATCLRDPYLRAVSTFYDKIINNRSTYVLKDFFEIFGKDLEVFRNDKIKYFDFFVDYLQNCDLNKSDIHIMLQKNILKLDIKKYDKVFNVSTISKEWSQLTKIFPKIPNLPKKIINKSNSDDFLNILNKRNLNKIKKIYEEDYEILASI